MLAACQPGSQTRSEARRTATRSEVQAAYRPPPTIVSVTREADGRLRLDGAADPGVHVRLAAPAGAVALARADAAGRWRASLPPSDELRLLGLSMNEQGRPIQSQGYLAVAPNGAAAQLRPGAGALTIGPVGHGPALLALDFDRRGAVVVTARASPGTPVDILVDGTTAARAAPDPGGRISVDLSAPLRPGRHVLSLVQGAARVSQDAILPDLPTPVAGPYQARRLGSAWFVDWTTPAGGVQGTLLFDDARAGARA
ncbi:MAG TPA: hypothetical protein VG248_12010 [Caulobacteraceae bacterium]|nr:hypothetical protein [Caulobacteraceae bacterium]